MSLIDTNVEHARAVTEHTEQTITLTSQLESGLNDLISALTDVGMVEDAGAAAQAKEATEEVQQMLNAVHVKLAEITEQISGLNP